jgi:penicillin-binding protein 1A
VNIGLQEAARESIERGLKELEERHPESAGLPPVEAALICLEPAGGAVRAMVGGRHFAGSEFNRAVQSRRQPGSAFKPFVYLAALDQGFSPTDVILDEPVEYNDNGRVWSPQNYDRRYNGPTTLYEGLVRSRNVVTVRLLEKTGLERVMAYAQAMGISSPLGRNLSLALGTSEVSLLEMVQAYAVIDNLGRRVEPRFITRIEDRDGRELARFPVRGRQVLDEASSYILLDMMKGVVERGTGARVAALGRPVAGKTGTTNDLADAWFIGFSPELAAGVWWGGT